MSNSSLVQYTRISPNRNSPRLYPIKKITVHHVAGVCSVETLGEIFAPTTRQGSSNYGIGSDGRIGMYVEEKDRSWCSSSYDNDHQAITIEVSNSQAGGNWPVSDHVLNRLIELCTDICKRNGIPRLNFTGDANGNLTAHRYFAQTACPGDYLYSKFAYIASEVNKRLQPQLTIEDIPNKKVVIKANTSLWDLSFTNINQAKSVKPFQQGDIIEVSAIATHSCGSKYYLTEYSFVNKINNGFNIVDCEDYVEPIIEEPIIEEPPIDEPIVDEQPVIEEQNDKDIYINNHNKVNVLVEVIKFIVNIIKKIIDIRRK